MVRALTHAWAHSIDEGPPTTSQNRPSKWNAWNGFFFYFHKLCTPGFEPWWEASHLEVLTNEATINLLWEKNITDFPPYKLI
jgi:hypothetical protein